MEIMKLEVVIEGWVEKQLIKFDWPNSSEYIFLKHALKVRVKFYNDSKNDDKLGSELGNDSLLSLHFELSF